MARAAAKGGKRTSAAARQRQQQQQRPAGRPGRRQLSQGEKALLFTRIRRQAKWAFVVMVLVFGVSFAVAGVGSGNGVNPFQSLFNGGGGGNSISGLEKKVQQHPKNAKAWHDLGLALAAKPDRQQDAVNALTRYAELRPNDPSGYADLAQTQAQQASGLASQWQLLQAKAYAWQSAATPPVSLTGKLAKAPGAADPVTQALQLQAQQASTNAAAARTTARDAYVQALASFQHAARLTPRDSTGWDTVVLQGINAMRSLGTDPALAKPALAAYVRLKKLDPTAAAQYKQFVPTLKQLAGIKGR